MQIKDFLYGEYDKNRKIIIWGNDEFALMTAYCLKELAIPFEVYADEAGYPLVDFQVISIAELAGRYYDEHAVVLLAMSGMRFKETLQTMEKHGVDEVYTIWDLLNKVDFYKSDYDEHVKYLYRFRHVTYVEQEKAINPDGFYCRTIDAMVTERCSLRCRDCSNLMQYYKTPKDLDVDALTNSIDIMVEKMDRIAQLRILGGEPFLNKDFVQIIDKYLNEPKIWQIAIYSNATIFPDEEVLKHLHHKKVAMRMSDYGQLSKKLDTWVEWCEENNVEYSVTKMDTWHDCGKLEKHDYSEGMLKAVYATCDCRNLPTIIDGRLYNCPYAANAANLGAMDAAEVEKDGLLLTREGLTSEEIDNFLYRRDYLEGCRYCNGRNMWRTAIKPFVQTKKPLEYERRIDRPAEIQTDKKATGKAIEENELVSIVVPVYNVAPYVERCIRSLMKQSYGKIEIIVIDDGSTDASIDICEALAKEDGRIVYIKNEHQGVAGTRNAGIEAATGKYLLFVDADDYVETEYVKIMLEEMGEYDAVFAGFIHEREEITENFQIAPDNKYIYIRTVLEEGVYCGERLRMLWDTMFHGHAKFAAANIWRFMYLTSKLKEVYKYIDTAIWMGEDTVLARAYLFQCDTIKLIAPAGYHNCARSNEGINKRYFYDKKGALENIDRLYWCMKRIIKGNADEAILKKFLDRELRTRILDVVSRYQADTMNFYYPYHGRLIGKRIVLYGAGNVGQSFRRSIMEAYESRLALWVDKIPREEDGIQEISRILDVDYDYVIVAIFDEKIYEQIKPNLVEMGVPEEKILWSRTRKEFF